MGRSTLNLLRRWLALDRDLGSRGGLRLAEFAETWGVDAKTVRRDLAAFRRLGYVAELVVPRPGVLYVWKYPPGRRPLFTANLRP